MKNLLAPAGRPSASTAAPIDLSSKLGLSMSEAAQVSGLSRSTLYILVKEGRLRVTKVGRRTVVPVSAIRDLLGMNG